MYNDESYEEIINTYTYEELKKEIEEEYDYRDNEPHYGCLQPTYKEYVLSVSKLKPGQSVEINETACEYTII